MIWERQWSSFTNICMETFFHCAKKYVHKMTLRFMKRVHQQIITIIILLLVLVEEFKCPKTARPLSFVHAHGQSHL